MKDAATSPAARYVTDVGYSATFTPFIAPDWLDLTALISGIAPPPRENGFAFCELACGRGLTAGSWPPPTPAARFTPST